MQTYPNWQWCLSLSKQADVSNRRCFQNFFSMEILRTSILKTYSAIEIHRLKWKEILKSCESSLKVIASLSDQLECVLKAEHCELSRNFPDLQGKLEQIIRALMEEEMTTMTVLLY